jgi:hypothetical protein
MADRLRALLDRPLDPSAARAILVFASAILVGVGGLFVFAASEPDQRTSPGRPSPGPAVPFEAVEEDSTKGQAEHHRQDPQDVENGAAAMRAARALRSHRAIQHVPYRRGDLAITLAGVRGERALLRVGAPSLPKARRGWRAFLRRYHDRGGAYIAHFVHRHRRRSR